MNVLPPKKRIENRGFAHETHSSDETSSNASDTTSSKSPSPITDQRLPVDFSPSPTSSPFSDMESTSVETISDFPQSKSRILESANDLGVLTERSRQFCVEGTEHTDIESQMTNLCLINPQNLAMLKTGKAKKKSQPQHAQRMFRPVMIHPFYRTPLPYHQILMASRAYHMQTNLLSKPPIPGILRPTYLPVPKASSFPHVKHSIQKRDPPKSVRHRVTDPDAGRLAAMPQDEFLDHCQEKSLSEDQTSLLKDLRRKGKNKAAARKCRQRKIDEINVYNLKVEEKEREIVKNESIMIENKETRELLVDRFENLRKELEDHQREKLFCSEHIELTASCLGKIGCKITIGLIHA